MRVETLTQHLKHSRSVYCFFSLPPGATTNVCVTDAFGVLNYLGHVKDREDVYHVLVNNASAFDRDRIGTSRHLTPLQKMQLLRLACTPLPLKQLVRLALREALSPGLPLRVESLPLPTVVKNYLLTG